MYFLYTYFDTLLINFVNVYELTWCVYFNLFSVYVYVTVYVLDFQEGT